jgi:hypothetical protein
VPIDAFLHWKEMSMRRGITLAALVGGFVAATTLPAAAQYVGWGDPGWDGGGVGVSIGFGAPGFYGGYAAYPSYYAAAPSYYAAAPGAYGYFGPSYGSYGYAGAPAYSYGSTTIYEPGYAYGNSGYEPGYAYGGSGYVGGYREGIRSRSYAAGSYAAGGYREGIRSRSAVRSARPEVGDRTFSRGTRGTSVRSTSAARPRGSAQGASMRGNETTGRGGAGASTSTGARGGASMQPSGMSGGASMQGGTTGQSGQMGGQPGAGR